MAGEGVETIGIEQLTPDPRNARRHTPRGVGMIQHSIQTTGAARSIVIDETGRILAGNATVEAAQAAGIRRVRVVESDGSELIAVVRPGLSEIDKLRLALADNRAGELSDFDGEVLASLSQEIDLGEFFLGDELARAMAHEADIESGDASQELAGMDYKIIVDCRDETHQSEMLRRFDEEGLTCRALIV